MNDAELCKTDWPRAIVFDLDGTLVDSADDIATALNATLARSDLAPFPTADVVRFIGGGIPALLTKAYSARGVTLDAETMAPILSDFRSVYSRCMTDTTRPYAGLVELVDRLIRRGIRIGVCTNKEEMFANGIVAGVGLRGRFTAVVGGMPGRQPKPSPLPLLETIAKLGAEPQTTIMVGDSDADLKCAQNAGVKFIGLSFGYSGIPLTNLGAKVVIDRYSEFEDACTRMLTETQ